MRKLLGIMLALWVAFIPLTRPDGTTAWVSTAWVQTVTTITPTDGSGCNPKAHTVLHLSSEILCVMESADEVGDQLNTAEAADGGPIGGKK